MENNNNNNNNNANNQKKNEEQVPKEEKKDENENLPSRILYPNDPKAPNVLVTFNHLTNIALK